MDWWSIASSPMAPYQYQRHAHLLLLQYDRHKLKFRHVISLKTWLKISFNCGNQTSIWHTYWPVLRHHCWSEGIFQRTSNIKVMQALFNKLFIIIFLNTILFWILGRRHLHSNFVRCLHTDVEGPLPHRIYSTNSPLLYFFMQLILFWILGGSFIPPLSNV